MNLMPAYEKWEAEKLAEGEKRGLKLGEKLGEKRGEERKGMEIAQRMLAKNIPIDEIADLTGLTIGQIQTLQKQ